MSQFYLAFSDTVENVCHQIHFREQQFIAVTIEKVGDAEMDDKKKKAYRYSWKSGELFTYYYDWEISTMKEVIYDCNSGGVPHKHCIDIMIANKYNKEY